MPQAYHYARDASDILVHGWDRASRDILAALAPEVFAKLDTARIDEQVQVDIRVTVQRVRPEATFVYTPPPATPKESA